MTEHVKKDEQNEPVAEVVADHPIRDELVMDPTKKALPAWLPWAAGVLILFLLIGSYAVGYQVGRRSNAINGRTGNTQMMRGGAYNDSPVTGRQGSGGMQGQMRGNGGTVGTITQATADSLTVNDVMRGGTVTYKIDGNTKVSDNTGNTKAVSDLKTGATVRVRVSATDTTVAGTIIITSTN